MGFLQTRERLGAGEAVCILCRKALSVKSVCGEYGRRKTWETLFTESLILAQDERWRRA